MRESRTFLAAPVAALCLMLMPPVLAAGGGGGGSAPSPSMPAYDPMVEYQKGTAAYRAGDFKAAVDHMKKVVAAAPKEPSANYLLGASHMGLGDYKKAIKPLEAAVKYNANLVEARRDLAISHLKLGDPAKAQVHIDAIEALATACAGTCPQASVYEGAMNRIAVEKSRPAASLAPAAPEVQLAEAKAADEVYVTAVSLINEARYDEAIAYLDAARWAAGPHPDVLTYLGFANRKLGRYEVAEGHYQAALAIAPNHRGALEYYGELKLERGNVAGARVHLAKLEALCGFGCNEADELRRWIAEKAPSAS